MSLPAETKAAFCSELLVARPSPSAPATSSEPSRPVRTPQDGVCFVLVSLDTLALRGAKEDKGSHSLPSELVTKQRRGADSQSPSPAEQ